MLHGEGSPTRHQAVHAHTSRLEAWEFVDLSEPKVVESRVRNRYSFIVREDVSRYTWVYVMRHKSDTPEMFKQFLMDTHAFGVLHR